MTTITIPRKMAEEKELVAIPRKEHERFLRLKKKRPYTQLDRNLDEAIKEVRQGKVIGPFSSVKSFRTSLEK